MSQIRVEEIKEGRDTGMWYWRFRDNSGGPWLAQSCTLFPDAYDANRSANSMKRILEERGKEVEIKYGEYDISKRTKKRENHSFERSREVVIGTYILEIVS